VLVCQEPCAPDVILTKKRENNELFILCVSHPKCWLGDCFIHSNCFISIPAWYQNQLAILQNLGAEIYPSIPSNHQTGEWKARSMVLFLHRIDESCVGVGDCWDSA
jgi:hypothetical protein